MFFTYEPFLYVATLWSYGMSKWSNNLDWPGNNFILFITTTIIKMWTNIYISLRPRHNNWKCDLMQVWVEGLIGFMAFHSCLFNSLFSYTWLHLNEDLTYTQVSLVYNVLNGPYCKILSLNLTFYWHSYLQCQGRLQHVPSQSYLIVSVCVCV